MICRGGCKLHAAFPCLLLPPSFLCAVPPLFGGKGGSGEKWMMVICLKDIMLRLGVISCRSFLPFSAWGNCQLNFLSDHLRRHGCSLLREMLLVTLSSSLCCFTSRSNFAKEIRVVIPILQVWGGNAEKVTSVPSGLPSWSEAKTGIKPISLNHWPMRCPEEGLCTSS